MNKWKRDPRKITSATYTSNNNIRFFNSKFCKLLFCFQTDYCLMKHNVIEYASKSVFCCTLLVRNCSFNSFTDCNAQTSRGVRIFFEQFASDFRFCAGACITFSSPGLHHYLAKWFLIKTDSHHENLALQSKERTGK